MSILKFARKMCILYIITAILWAVCSVLSVIALVASFSAWTLIVVILDFFLVGSNAYLAFSYWKDWRNAAEVERGNDNE